MNRKRIVILLIIFLVLLVFQTAFYQYISFKSKSIEANKVIDTQVKYKKINIEEAYKILKDSGIEGGNLLKEGNLWSTKVNVRGNNENIMNILAKIGQNNEIRVKSYALSFKDEMYSLDLDIVLES